MRLALDHSDASSVLERAAPTTLFAPTDEAFDAAALDDEAIVALFAPDLALQLQYHIVDGRFGAAQLPALALAFGGGGLLNDTSRLLDVELIGTDGRAHLIDEVVSPLNVLEFLEVRRLSDLVDLVDRSGALTDLRDPPRMASASEVLRTEVFGSLTVFAPTSSAFSAASDLDETEDLTQRLGRHIVTGAVPRRFEDAQPTLVALTGQLALSRDPDTVTLRYGTTANVSRKNIGCTNGLVHVIDTVLEPSE